jgi:hypothetical protein
MNYVNKLTLYICLFVFLCTCIYSSNSSAKQPKNENMLECTANIESWLSSIKEIVELCIFTDNINSIPDELSAKFIHLSIISYNMKGLFEYIDKQRSLCSISKYHNDMLEETISYSRSNFTKEISDISKIMNEDENKNKILESLKNRKEHTINITRYESLHRSYDKLPDSYTVINNYSSNIHSCMNKYNNKIGPFAEISNDSMRRINKYFQFVYSEDELSGHHARVKERLFNECRESMNTDIPDYKKLIKSLINISTISNEIAISLISH